MNAPHPGSLPLGGEREKNFWRDAFSVTRRVLARVAGSLSSPKGGEGWGEEANNSGRFEWGWPGAEDAAPTGLACRAVAQRRREIFRSWFYKDVAPTALGISQTRFINLLRLFATMFLNLFLQLRYAGIKFLQMFLMFST